MAELCRKCFNNNFSDLVKDGEKVIMSKDKDVCESCGKYDYTVDRVDEKGFIDGVVEFVKKFGA